MTIKRKRKSGRTRTVQSRKQQIEKMDQQVKLLLESQLKQKEDQLKKLNLEYDESVKNLHENIEQKKSDEQ